MSKNSKYLHIEILIWIIAVLLLLLGVSVSYRNSQQQYEIHKIFLEDVDGLIVGSPVKLMGVQVGYINRMRIVGDNIYVRFIIKDKNLHLPWGTVATVEFSGMAGSRSLELYPPSAIIEEENVDYIKVVNPTRLSHSMSLLYEMYNKFMDICFGMSNFAGQIKNSGIDTLLKNNNTNKTKNSHLQFAKFLEFTNDWLDNSNNKVLKFREKHWKEK